MKTLLIYLAFALTYSGVACGQEIINLYSGDIPNSKFPKAKEASKESSGLVRKVINPTLEVYLPEKEKSTGTAVIICAGGSYAVIVYQGEGVSTAKEFARKGVAAFVLKYRLPSDSMLVDKKTGPLQDALQAIKVVRENAAKWGVDVNKVGIMGFSAGGHLASTVATMYKEPLIENKMGTSLRPDFQILVYPVISMQDSLTHVDSRANLLGKNPGREVINRFSSELRVDVNTPPAYLTHSADDKLVDVDNSIVYFETLRHHHVPVELHVYQEGGHGFIFKHPGWYDPMFEWMKNLKLIK
ncbi:MAG TPA: alpha/beta hydrolase [Chryseolinea sp.]|nr:alpha/beta hydrolase [Chryseolinea sp.]